MITAICEMVDQDRRIEAVRLIENTPEAIESFEKEMDEMMCMFGYQLYFYDAIIPERNNKSHLSYVNEQAIVYQWMQDNENEELDL